MLGPVKKCRLAGFIVGDLPDAVEHAAFPVIRGIGHAELLGQFRYHAVMPADEDRFACIFRVSEDFGSQLREFFIVVIGMDG